MGRGDTQGLDFPSPAMSGLLCGRAWLLCLLRHSVVRVWQLRPSLLKQQRRTLACVQSYMPRGRVAAQGCRGESGWCSDMTSTHGVWRHAGVRFLLSGGRWPKPPSVRQSSWVKPASRSEPKATRSMAMEIHCQCLRHSWVSEAHMAAWSSGMILA